MMIMSLCSSTDSSSNSIAVSTVMASPGDAGGLQVGGIIFQKSCSDFLSEIKKNQNQPTFSASLNFFFSDAH